VVLSTLLNNGIGLLRQNSVCQCSTFDSARLVSFDEINLRKILSTPAVEWNKASNVRMKRDESA